MITIKLLGGARKAVGKATVNLDRPSASVSEILDFLTNISAEPRLLQRGNLIIALNDIDSASLQGHNTIVKSGDLVKIVTVVHGGMHHILDGYHLSINGIEKIIHEPGKLLDLMRSGHSNVLIQAVNANAVYGEEHVLGILRIVVEAGKRNIMIANRYETELLIRLACTDQISKAMEMIGLKKDAPGCFIAFSQDQESLRQFEIWIKSQFNSNDSILRPNENKRKNLASMLGFKAKIDDNKFLQYLLEKAAIMVR